MANTTFNEMLTARRQQPKPAEKPAYRPQCSTCEDYGYVGCPEARAPNGKGDFLAIALSNALACACVAGRQFAEAPAEWKKTFNPRNWPEEEERAEFESPEGTPEDLQPDARELARQMAWREQIGMDIAELVRLSLVQVESEEGIPDRVRLTATGKLALAHDGPQRAPE